MTTTQDHPEASAAKDHLAVLSLRVFEALEAGVAETQEHFDEGAPDPWLFPHMVRYAVWRRLSEAGEFVVTQLPMSGIEIEYMGYRVRLFKRCGMEGEFLYPPGHSKGRQDFYEQQLQLPGVSHLFAQRRNVAYVWEVVDGELELWLVSPDGFEHIWKPGRVRWSITIPHPVLEMAAEAAFTDSDDSDDLPLELEDLDAEESDEES